MADYTYLVLCKHEGNDKPFLFEAPTQIFPDTEVLVETKRGNSHATVIGSQFTERDSDLYKMLIELAGAKLPLKRVLGKFMYTEYQYEKEA